MNIFIYCLVEAGGCQPIRGLGSRQQQLLSVVDVTVRRVVIVLILTAVTLRDAVTVVSCLYTVL